MSRISFGSKGEEGRKKQRMDKVNTKCKNRKCKISYNLIKYKQLKSSREKVENFKLI